MRIIKSRQHANQGNGTVNTAALRGLSSVLSQRTDFASKHGKSFITSGGTAKRDIYTSFGYIRNPTIHDYRAEYRRGGIAKRIIEAAPKATWLGSSANKHRNSGIVITSGDSVGDSEVETEFDGKLKELFLNLDMWTKILRADIQRALGSFSVLLIGAPGELVTELPMSLSVDDVKWITPFPEDKVTLSPQHFEKNLHSKRYNLPSIYTLDLGTNHSTVNVHWSRVIHVVEDPLDDEINGAPELEAIYNYLLDLQKVHGGGAETFWKLMDPGRVWDMDPTVAVTTADRALIVDEIDDFRHGLNRDALMQGVTPKQLTPHPPNYSSNVRTTLTLIAGTKEIPIRILIGSERGELASTQDRNNWLDKISRRDDSFAVPLLRSIVDRFILYGILPEEDYKVIVPEIDQLDLAEKADFIDKLTKANKQQTDSGQRPVMSTDELRAQYLGMDESSEDVVKDDEDVVKDVAAVDVWGARDVRSAAAALESSTSGIAIAIQDTWTALADEIRNNAAVTALDVVDNFGLKSSMLSAVEPQLSDAYVLSGVDVMNTARRDGGFLIDGVVGASLHSAVDFDLQFTVDNPRAATWAEINAARLVTEITSDTRDAVALVVSQGIGGTVPEIAKLLPHTIGLRTDQVNAVIGLSRRMSESRAGTVVNAGKRSIAIPSTGVTPAIIQREIERYANTLLQQRLILIARTEALNTANEGQLEAWQQAREAGQLSSDVVKVLIVTVDERTRDEHYEINGQRQELSDDFELLTGEFFRPGRPPHCRCTQGLARR